jgi:hypothetical protein
MSKRTILLLALGALAALVVGWQVIAFAGPVGDASGFEDDDGNLAPNPQGLNFDWNSFAPVNWTTGTAPFRQSDQVVSGWQFKGVEDDEARTSDTGFAGGTKQDDPCANVIGAKAPNKDDLKRIYLSSKTVNGDTFLNLAWVRIPLNTTESSAHIGFEFNKATTSQQGGSCGEPGGLVHRTAGDLLIVYDFEGGDADNPTLTLRRWVTSGACEVGSNRPPCWGPSTNLTAEGFAEARVNTTSVGTVTDLLTPPNPPATTSVSSTLGLNEFGEAGINLTDAGVFSANTCESFGTAYAVSRSSGSSATAQMKDLVGPAPFTLQNCGTVKIIKQTDPRGLNQNFDFTSTLAGAQISCTADTMPASFTLNDNGNAGKTLGSTEEAQNSAGNTETCTNVPVGSYTVEESDTDPAGFFFDRLTCTASGTGTSVTTSGKQASITMAGGGSVTCLYTNKQKAKPSIATTLSSESIEVGGTIHDSARLTGATPDAGGSVTYTVYTNDTCTQDPRDAGTKTVTNGVVPDSDPVTFNQAGDYYWQAVYSGDSNNNGATSVCTSEHLVVGKKSPSITTTLSDEEITVGDSIHDSATLTGATADAGGTVTYTVYTNDTCTAGARDAGTKNVTNGSVPDSDPLQFNTAGEFYWQAVYSGDANNQGATSVCTSEHLVVGKASPSITTTLSDESIQVGESIHDSATLSGATPDAGGSVTYTVYTNDTCTQDPRDAGTKTVTNGVVPDSNTLQFDTPGDFYWQAVYSGDSNNQGATSVCTSEHLVVGKAPSTQNTAQSFYPNDEATLSASAASGTPTGNVTFSLFDNDTCSGTPIYGPVTDDLSASGTASTSNTTFAISSTKTVYWKVEYEGDDKHEAVSSCTENTVLTIDNGGPVTSN